jgi:acyl-CoA thioester hydrolase
VARSRGGVIGVGLDLQSVREVRNCAALREPGFFFSAGELARAARAVDPLQTIAGLFAAKEALFKALPETASQQAGTWYWPEAELVHDGHGAPRFVMHGSLARRLAEHGWRTVVSVTHSGGFAMAIVLVSGSHTSERHDMYFEPTHLTMPVRPNDLDRLGHVNHAVALEYMEASRWHWLANYGLQHDEETIPVVARAEIDYLAEIRDGPVTVTTTLVSPNADDWQEGDIAYRAIFRQTVQSPGQASGPAVDARITVAFLDARQHCLVPLQEYLCRVRKD